jgi:hypothetical protein
MKAFAKTIMIIMAAIIVIALAIAFHSDNERNQKIEATTSPQEFISLEIYEPKANVEVRRIQDSLLVTYDLDPWMMTGSSGKSSFTLELEKIIPGAFYKFRDINSITITATAAFSDDIRGHSRGRGDVLRATFSRANAESIVWDHIVLDDLPQIADKFWQAPNLIKDDSK